MRTCLCWRQRRRRGRSTAAASSSLRLRRARAASAKTRATAVAAAPPLPSSSLPSRRYSSGVPLSRAQRRRRGRGVAPLHVDVRDTRTHDASKHNGDTNDDVLQWLLGVPRAVFFRDYFEKQPLHCVHGSADYFTRRARNDNNSSNNNNSGLDSGDVRQRATCAVRTDGDVDNNNDDHRSRDDDTPVVSWSTEAMLRAVREHTVYYDADVSVVRVDAARQRRVSYTEHDNNDNDDNNNKQTSSSPSRRVVTEDELRACMRDGWSVRFLRPHAYARDNTTLLARLERVFACAGGVNSYWTPPRSQGFAAHADDVDVFLVQLEGVKVWRLYAPVDDDDDVGVLNRYSSDDYTAAQLPAQPLHTCTLRAGDVLYLPRGLVHQGHTLADTHSLHVTFSVNQRHTYADLLQRAAAYTIETLATNKLRWRRTLRPSYARLLGTAQARALRVGCGVRTLSRRRAARRAALQRRWRSLVADMAALLVDATQMDVCTDVYARDVLARMQPPPPATPRRATTHDDDEHATSTPHQPQLQQHEAVTTARDDDDDEENVRHRRRDGDGDNDKCTAAAAAAAATETAHDDNDTVRVCDDTTRVRLCSPHGYRLLFDEAGVVKLYHNGHNALASTCSTQHTAAAAAAAELRFDAAFAPALLTLWTHGAHRRPVALHTLPMPDCDDDAAAAAANRQLLAQTLLQANVLECVS